MEWTRSETLALAAPKCMICQGSGLLLSKKGKLSPCHCVLRAVFRACFLRFRHCVRKEKQISRAALEFRGIGRGGRIGWGMKDEEYIADFCLVSRRTLNEEEYAVFRYHFLLGADWRLCCRKLETSRGRFFNMVYRIEHKLGRVFRELEPYALFPLDEYFGGSIRGIRRTADHGNVVRFEPVRPTVPALLGSRPEVEEDDEDDMEDFPEPLPRTA